VQPTEAEAADFAGRVVRWQRQCGRHHLPWQNTRDAYRIWVSEIMLQQTQVSTVERFYPTFIERFPSLPQLAVSPLDEVLSRWSGLGYYRRARFMHNCARQVLNHHAGEFPADEKLLAKLPGIGRSTAAAIAVFAFDRRAAILDGNVKRVLARVFALALDMKSSYASTVFWSLAESLLPASDEMASYTQGLMDLGATRCLHRNPRCNDCPLRDICRARQEGRQLAYPLPKEAKPIVLRHWMMVWISDGKHLLLIRRPDQGIWASMWSLPEVHDLPRGMIEALVLESSGEASPGARRRLAQRMHSIWQQAGAKMATFNGYSAQTEALLRASMLDSVAPDYCGDMEQRFTHFRLRAPVLCISFDPGDARFNFSHIAFEPRLDYGESRISTTDQPSLWIRFEDALELGIPNALRKRVQAALEGGGKRP